MWGVATWHAKIRQAGDMRFNFVSSELKSAHMLIQFHSVVHLEVIQCSVPSESERMKSGCEASAAIHGTNALQLIFTSTATQDSALSWTSEFVMEDPMRVVWLQELLAG